MRRLARLFRGEISLRRALLRLVEAANARLGRRAQGRLYFENIYREGDPWLYETSPYEQAKYAKTLELLPQPHFLRALEVGCSIGVFTQRLSVRADEVVGIDISARACRRARARCREQRHVRIERADLSGFSDARGFDLVVCAEMLYYLWELRSDRSTACHRVAELLRPGGWLVLVFGGGGVGQDWEAEMERTGKLVRQETRFFEDLERPWRLSVLQKRAQAVVENAVCVDR